VRALCLHGHFYQPPREHPWLGVVDPEASAAPARDWNARITAECYAPNAAARLLDSAGCLRRLVSTYEWTSFNFGPTLLSWLATHAPAVVAALVRADAASRARTGHGNAWAQAYGHPILPLSTPRDVRTQVRWGARDFEHRFGRKPEGMWLPEMAVDLASLAALADAGIAMTMLAPHQARRVRPLGADEEAWTPVDAATLDTRRLYRCPLPGGGSVDVLFRDADLSRDIAFGALLGDGAGLAASLRAALERAGDGAIVAVAVDGETYGHHHRFAEMALAFALHALAADPAVSLLGPAAFREAHPATHEVEIVERTSWSCLHGVERWRAGCGCRVGGPPEWSQAWRAPLREAIDWLRDALASVYERAAGEVLREPWEARDRYVDCLLEPARRSELVAREARRPLSPGETGHALRALELGRHALLMQTSCGWFFDELTGIEPVQVLRYAARAIDLAATFGASVEADFEGRLAGARSNLPAGGSGADVYRRSARGAAATPARVAATGALMVLVGATPEVPGHTTTFEAAPHDGRLAGRARIVELATDTASEVVVSAVRDGQGAPTCLAGEAPFTLADLFGVQRERLLVVLGEEATAAAREARRAALARVRAVVDGALIFDAVLPPELATLVGWEGAEAVVAALEEGTRAPAALVAEVAALRCRRATLPGGWLGARLAEALRRHLDRLPAGAPAALGVLDVAHATGVLVDLASAQVQLLTWWTATPEAARGGADIAALLERLRVAPNGS
jgi:alpha-amylase/alpha-mannosidase (GH57 family)